jgi:hypothetical protein
MRVFETHSPGRLLLCVIAGVGTLLWGLTFAVAFVVGMAALAAAHFLDTYGLESEDR